MKKAIYVLLAALTIIGMVSCGGGGGGGVTTFNVTFDFNDSETEAVVVSVPENGTVPAASIPEDPEQDGYLFTGWFTTTGDTGGIEFNPLEPITGAVTYYARWIAFDPATQVRVTFDYNYQGGPGTALRIVTKDGTIGTANFPAAPARSGWYFLGWFTVSTSTGGTEFKNDTNVGTVDQTVFARWVVSVGFTYNANGGVGTNTVQIGAGQSYTITDGVTISYAGKIFTGWNTLADGTGTAYAIAQVVTAGFTTATTVYAQWKTPDAIASTDEIVETISLGNSWFAVYSFKIPVGKTWADYKMGGLVASYKLDQETLDNGMARAIRVMGNFTDAEVNGTVYTYASTQATGADGAALAGAGPLIDLYNGIQMAAVAQWQGGASAPYILSQMGGAWADNNMGPELSKLGVEPAADEWFELSYVINGTKKNGSHDSAKRLPADIFDGTLYFAIGLPGQNTANTVGVKNVILVGTTAGTDDVLGMPLYYKNTNAGAGATPLYRAYNGQFTKDGTNGTELANWEILSGDANIVPVEKDLGAAPALVTITFNSNYGSTPATKTLKVISGEKLASGQLSKPERDGFLCTGWFDRPESTASEGEPNDSIEITNATEFTADKAIYAQWRTFTPNMTPWVIENPTMALHGGAHILNGYIHMASGTVHGAEAIDGVGAYDSLVCFSFVDADLALIAGCPDNKIAGFLKIKVEYEAVNGTSTDSATGDAALSVGVKNGVDSFDNTPAALRPSGFDGYPNLTATGSLEWPLSLFSAPPTGKKMGFGLQCNTGGHSNDWNLKITKITFSYN
jgi:uncharacterized repeat protein (TIGR02543 family)